MTPIVDRLQVEFDGRVSVYRLNAAQEINVRIQSQWGLRGHPSFAVLDEDGSIVHQFFGPQTEIDLRQAMESVINQ
ncbi:MAG: TlpA family protein disulfide reductase [Candidatus Promineifilaceae bacterium]